MIGQCWQRPGTGQGGQVVSSLLRAVCSQYNRELWKIRHQSLLLICSFFIYIDFIVEPLNRDNTGILLEI